MITVRERKKEKMEHDEGATAILRLQTPQHKGKEREETKRYGPQGPEWTVGTPPKSSLPAPVAASVGFAISAKNDQEVMTSPRGHLLILKASPLNCHSCFGAMVCNRNRMRAKYVM